MRVWVLVIGFLACYAGLFAQKNVAIGLGTPGWDVLTWAGAAQNARFVGGYDYESGTNWLARLDTVGAVEWARQTPFNVTCGLARPTGPVLGGYAQNALVFAFCGTDGAPTQTFLYTSGDAAFYPADLQAAPDGGYAMTGSLYAQNQIQLFMAKFAADGTFLWAKTYAAPGAIEPYALKALADGSFALCGYLNGYGAGGADGFILRLDATGEIISGQSYGGALNDYLTDFNILANGDVLAAGTTYSSGGGVSDGWYLRLKPDGTPLWGKTYGGEYPEEIWKATPVSDGLITCGMKSYYEGYDDVWLTRITENGAFLYEKRMGGVSPDAGRTIAPLTNGGFLIAGNTVIKSRETYVILSDSALSMAPCVAFPAVESPALRDSMPFWTNVTLVTQPLTFALNPGPLDAPSIELTRTPLNVTVKLTATSVSCPGAADGTIIAEVEGGLPPYRYTLTGDAIFPALLDSIGGLSGGFYTVLIKDLLGCRTQDTISVTEADALNPHATPQSETCLYAKDGRIKLATSGGKPPYQTEIIDEFGLAWSVAPNATVENLAPGAYRVKVTDLAGCVVETDLDILSGVTLSGQTEDTLRLTLPQSVRLKNYFQPDGGIWRGAVVVDSVAGIVHFVQAGTYNLRYVLNGCIKNLMIIVEELHSTPQLPGVFTPNGDGVNDRFAPQTTNGAATFRLEIYDRWGRRIFSGENEGWDGRETDGTPAPQTVYYYRLVYTPQNKPTIERAGSITLLR